MKIREMTAKPSVARAYILISVVILLMEANTYNDAVIPGKDGQLVEPGHKIPPRSDVPSNEDANGQGGEWVHASEWLRDGGE